MNLEGVFNVLGSICVIALVAVLVKPHAQTPQVLTAGGNAFGGVLTAAGNA